MRNNILMAVAFALMLLIPTTSNAQNKILKVSDKLKRVGIELGSLKVGDTVEAKANGKSCQIKVVKVTDKLAVGDAASCESIAALNGQSVTLSSSDANWDEDDELDLDDEPNTKNKRSKDQEKKKSKSGFGVGLYYSTANEIEVNGTITVSPSPQTSFSEKISTDMGLGLSLFYLNVPTGKLGSFVSLDYELPRSMKSVNGTVGNTKINGTSSSKFSLLTLVSNLAYGVTDNSILYAGINWPAIITVTDSDGEKYYGSIGFQGGYAHRFNDIFFGTVEYRFVNGKETYSNGSASGNADFKFNGFNLRIGFNF